MSKGKALMVKIIIFAIGFLFLYFGRG